MRTRSRGVWVRLVGLCVVLVTAGQLGLALASGASAPDGGEAPQPTAEAASAVIAWASGSERPVEETKEGEALSNTTIGVWLAPTGEVAGLCPLEALVGALGGRVRARAEGHLNASLPEGELKLTAGEQRAVYQGKEYVLAAAPVRGSDGLYLAAPVLGRLLDRKVEEQGEEALFLAAPTRDGLQLLEARLYTEGPAWYLVGQVQNTGKFAQELLKVSWEVGNATGEVVAATSGYINHLNPGEAKAFKLMLPLRGDGAWYRIRTAPGFPARPRRLSLTATARRYHDRPVSYLSLLGQVQNSGDQGYDFLKVIVEFYAVDGKLVDMDSVFLSHLDPGEDRAFTVYTGRVEEAAGWQMKFD